jgi:hypothetical protein
MGNCCGGTAIVPSEPIPPLLLPARTAQTNHQASNSLSDGSSSVVSSSHGSNEKHARAAVQANRETVTISISSSIPRAPMPSRALSQDWESSQPHRDGIEDLLSFGDALASQDPHRQETVLQRTRLHTPGRTARRMNSENVLGNGRTPQFGPFLTAGVGQMPAEGQEVRPRFPSTLQSLLSNDFRYAVGHCPISP